MGAVPEVKTAYGQHAHTNDQLSCPTMSTLGTNRNEELLLINTSKRPVMAESRRRLRCQRPAAVAA